MLGMQDIGILHRLQLSTHEHLELIDAWRLDFKYSDKSSLSL
jgi:hypothetical protein